MKHKQDLWLEDMQQQASLRTANDNNGQRNSRLEKSERDDCIKW